MEKKPVIVVGNDHENTLNVVRSLGKANYEVILLLITNTNKTFTNKSKYVSQYIPIETEEKVVSYLQSHSFKDYRIPILTTSDLASATLDYHRGSLVAQYFIPNCHNIPGEIKKEMDKNRMCDIADRSGFFIPRTIAFYSSDLLIEKVGQIRFPVILKPMESIEGSKNDFRICNDIMELEEAIKSTKLDRALIQEYIPNDEVLVVSGIRTPDKQNLIFGYINKVKHGHNYNNLGLNAMGIYINKPLLQQECTRFLESLDYEGPYSFDLVRSQNRIYFMEINLRTDGLLFFYDEAGINIPAIWADSCYGKPYSNPITVKDKVIGINEFQYIKNNISVRRIFENFKDFITADRFAIFSIKDLKPMFFKFKNH